MNKNKIKTFRHCLLMICSLNLILAACVQPFPKKETWTLNSTPQVKIPEATATFFDTASKPTVIVTPYVPFVRQPGAPLHSPTPDQPKILPTLRTAEEIYTVQPNDTLNRIIRNFGVDMRAIIERNELTNPDLLEIGQVLIVPPPNPDVKAPAIKIIPDAELIFGPTTVGFHPHDLVYSFENSYLASLEFSDEVIYKTARDNSVNPRLLVALLEYATGWVTGPRKVTPEDPAIPKNEQELEKDAWKSDLVPILTRMANSLNWGYYAWKDNRLSYFVLKDGSYIPANETSNAGTVGIQQWAAGVFNKEDWFQAVGENGIIKTYEQFFGYPFDYTYEPLVPEGLTQPEFLLPIQKGVAWSFTGGPHPAWGDGTPWAALDFAPPGSPMGCNISGDWATAITDGWIVRSEDGLVVQELDGDGCEQTGWAILYLHISEWERVQEGSFLSAGDLIGHPSCDGGVSYGTHLHIARKYNGEWIDAAGDTPFVMSGFQPVSDGIAYNGFLVNNEKSIEACGYYTPESLIQH